MLLGADTSTRVNSLTVGWPPERLPLKTSTQPWIVKAPLALAVALPLPTFARPHCAMACARSPPVGVHLGTAPGLTRKSSSKLSRARFVAPPGFELPGFV